MKASHLLLLYNALVSHAVSINTDHSFISKTKIELKPLFISCRINDIVTISAPMLDTNALYYLTKPNGDVTKINIKQPSYIKKNQNKVHGNEITVKNINRNLKPVITPVNNYEIFDMNGYINDVETNIEANDIAIGPLIEEDCGNWVLSVYDKDLNGDWIELFQVITIEIVEIVPSSPENATFKTGDDFKLSFAYPIRNLETCELIAPGSTFDRFYTRSNIEFDRCGYVIDNVTKADRGLWTIIGVGRIVYETQIYLKILNTIT